MRINEFRKVVSTFCDPGTEIVTEKNQLIIQVNDIVIEANITEKEGDIYVSDDDVDIKGGRWIIKRLANLSLLASRIASFVDDNEHYVSPCAKLLESLDNVPHEHKKESSDAAASLIDNLSNKSPFDTKVLYITSDAGEGKTTLINHVARMQAEKYKNNETDWVLVPIPLGGRNFLRFDDITIGALQNRYRFPFLHYKSFLALVRMGVIIPAYDGFEEMFVETSSGEALSAMGILVRSMESQGSFVVAARKAYFEFENLKVQEKLFDNIKDYSVEFEKLEICRWSRQQFVDYCDSRGVPDPNSLYEKVSQRLGPDHAMLTRAVLVKNLVDLAIDADSVDEILQKLSDSGADYFTYFVRGIVAREANEKWIDRSGDGNVGRPLLTIDEHMELLSIVSMTMWESKVDYLKQDTLDFAADYFSELNAKSSYEAQQIRKRIGGHALLVPSVNMSGAVAFDHDEFRMFFLGEGIAKLSDPGSTSSVTDLSNILRRGVLTKQTYDSINKAVIRRNDSCRESLISLFVKLSGVDGRASYIHENCSVIIMGLLNGVEDLSQTVKSINFGLDSLKDRVISGVYFEGCHFSSTSLECAHIKDCSFSECHFSELKLKSASCLEDVVFHDCKVDALQVESESWESWDPQEIKDKLIGMGIVEGVDENKIVDGSELSYDQSLRDLEKVIRYFMRSTHISESVIRIKLGSSGQRFIDEVMPRLVSLSIFQEIENRGGNVQKRFKLSGSLEKINQAIRSSKGSFEKFILFFS